MIVTTTPDELTAIVAPFVNARLNRQRDENGYYVERTAFVDIATLGHRAEDANVRDVTSEGITTVFDGMAEFTAWADVREIVVRREGREDVTYLRVAKLARAA